MRVYVDDGGVLFFMAIANGIACAVAERVATRWVRAHCKPSKGARMSLQAWKAAFERECERYLSLAAMQRAFARNGIKVRADRVYANQR